ncbi:hypothetical protein BpHYR1_004726, partial [Brachionus plicatilis]
RSGDGDHFPIELELEFELLKIESNHRSPLNYRKANWEKFKRSLDSCIFDLLSGDINHINSQISTQILDAANSEIPKFQKILKNHFRPIYQKQDKVNQGGVEDLDTFLKSVGPNPNSSRPFWKKVNSFKNNSYGNVIPRLVLNSKEFKKDSEKGTLFRETIGETFTQERNDSFDNDFRDMIEEFVANKDYLKDNHYLNL